MNSTFRFAAKACLVTATSGLLLSPTMKLVAEDSSGPASKPSASSRVQQTAAVQSAEQDSAVQKELQKLYRKNRREMPSMDMSDAPNTQGPIPPQTNAASRPGAPLAAATPSAPAAAPAAATEPKANWFERTFHIGRGKRKPAPVAEYAAPAQSRNAPYRMTNPSQPARPANPAYRAPLAAGPGYQAPPTGMNPGLAPPPVVAGPAASAPPAQPQLREPAPLAPSTTARELTVRPQQQPMQQRPPTVLPARPRVGSQPLLDESGAGNDTESLDLDDSQPKAAAPAPQILSNRNESQRAPASPYSGLKIAPNEAEQQITSQPQKPAREDTDDEDVEDLASSPKAAHPIVTEPADEKPAVATPAKPRTGLAPKDDDDDDDDEEDDEDMLSFPTAKSDGKPRALPETAVLKAAKMLEKLDVPVAAASKAASPTAPVAAPAVLDEKTEKSSAAPAEIAAKPTTAPADVAAKPASITAEAAKAVITPAPAAVANPAAPAVAAAPAVSAPATVAAPGTPVVMPQAVPAVDAATSSPIGGLKGICPVALKDYRKLIDAQLAIHSTYKGKTYHFSTVEAKQAFDENPHKYAPVRGGSDVVLQTSGKADVAGSLEHAAWYRGRLYLFSTAESRHEFVDTPSKFVVED